MKSKGILEQIARTVRQDYPGDAGGAAAGGLRIIRRRISRKLTRRLAGGFQVIAEVKKGSPSRGIFRKDFDPLALARQYAAGGAAAVSIVTERRFFYGNPRWIPAIRQEVSLPLLRKDFILTPRQVIESYNLGADLVLLISALLGNDSLTSLAGLCRQLGMEILLEVHDPMELERLADLDLVPDLLGFNNRNLRDFSVDIRRSLQLKKEVDRRFHWGNRPVYLISESGIRSGGDIRRLQEAGFNGALVGESLITAPDSREVLERWLN